MDFATEQEPAYRRQAPRQRSKVYPITSLRQQAITSLGHQAITSSR